jgi:cell division protease FtsH
MRREFSEETAREIDCAVREIVTRAFDAATLILEQRRDWLERGARLLLEKETLIEEDLAPFRSSVAA